jgi:hypothetical protein
VRILGVQEVVAVLVLLVLPLVTQLLQAKVAQV